MNAPRAMPPLVLDLFCCAGGAARGYQRADFLVDGVDIVPRPNYCGENMIVMDALHVLRELIDTGEIGRYTLVHASPPCQKGNPLTIGTNQSKGWGKQADKVQIIPELRALLNEAGVPYVIEQPASAKGLIRQDVMLCMDMFPIEPPRVFRHRYFELGGWNAFGTRTHLKHSGRVRGWRHGTLYEGDYVAAYGNGGGKATVAEMQHALGIDWTDVREELTEAIPPAYTEWLGRQLIPLL